MYKLLKNFQFQYFHRSTADRRVCAVRSFSHSSPWRPGSFRFCLLGFVGLGVWLTTPGLQIIWSSWRLMCFVFYPKMLQISLVLYPWSPPLPGSRKLITLLCFTWRTMQLMLSLVAWTCQVLMASKVIPYQRIRQIGPRVRSTSLAERLCTFVRRVQATTLSPPSLPRTEIQTITHIRSRKTISQRSMVPPRTALQWPCLGQSKFLSRPPLRSNLEFSIDCSLQLQRRAVPTTSSPSQQPAVVWHPMFFTPTVAEMGRISRSQPSTILCVCTMWALASSWTAHVGWMASPVMGKIHMILRQAQRFPLQMLRW